MYSYLQISGIIDKVETSNQHSQSKKIEKFLSGFDPEDPKWLNFLASVFFDIFINFNYQFVNLLKSPVDSWSKVMWKLAADVVYRMFDGLANIEEHQNLTKDLIIKCVLMGQSNTTNYFTAAVKRTKHLGKQIKVKKGTEEKNLSASKLIERPQVLYKLDDIWFSKVETKEENRG